MSQLRFETETIDSRMAALPSGKLIVDTGRELKVLDEKQRVTTQATAAQVCGTPAGFPIDGPYRTALFAGSEDVAVISFERPAPGFPPRPPSEPGFWCWFSTGDLRRMAQTRFADAVHAAARGLVAYVGTWSVSSKGIHALSIPPSQTCNVPDIEQKFPNFYLLRAEPAEVFRCHEGTISVKRGDQISTIALKGSEGWYFRTDAWNVPLAIFVGGSFHVPLFGGNFTGTTKIGLVNYRTSTSVLLPELKINARPPMYAGQTREYAISPNGRYVAVLHGPVLSVYETPTELLK